MRFAHWWAVVALAPAGLASVACSATRYDDAALEMPASFAIGEGAPAADGARHEDAPAEAARAPSFEELERARDETVAVRDGWRACAAHWAAPCATTAASLRHVCGAFGDACPRMTRALDRAEAHEICAEGSVVECGAACDAGHGYACLALAQMLHVGARVPRDPARADALVASACDAGNADACAQRALWLRQREPERAASLALRACVSDGDVGAVACTLFMEVVEKRAPAIDESALVAGLEHTCAAEERGEVAPGREVRTSDSFVEYYGGACGRLKDRSLPH